MSKTFHFNNVLRQPHKYQPPGIGNYYKDPDSPAVSAPREVPAREARPREGGGFAELVRLAEGLGNGTYDELYRENKLNSAPVRRYALTSTADLAEPVPPMEWLIRKVWPSKSYGVMGGAKKTLKSYNLLSLSVAVASGKPLFGEFDVAAPGAVLYYSGEGAKSMFQRRIQAVCASYGVDLRELDFFLVNEAGSLSERDFIDGMKANLDAAQPQLVIVDPLYSYHPPGIDAANLYDRGAMLAGLRETVGEGAALIVADHFKKSANELDLDTIAQSGMGAWADSWILQKHREAADLESGEYRLAVEFGSRQWGGGRWNIDWTIPVTDEEGRTPPGENITWNVHKASGGGNNSDDRIRRVIEQILTDEPFQHTRTAVREKVGGNKGRADAVLGQLISEGLILVEKRKKKEGTREVARELLGLRAPGAKLQL